MKRPLLCALALALTLLPAPLGFARGPRAKPRAIEHHDTVISSISADSISIDENKTPKTFKITQFTEVTLHGQRAKVDDLKPGMAVSVTVGIDPMSAARIAAGDAPVHYDPPGTGSRRGKK